VKHVLHNSKLYLCLGTMMATQDLKKVLLVSIAFPPDPAVGSLRPGSFAKYLPKYGWTPITITKKFNDIENFDENQPNSLDIYGQCIRTYSFPHPMQWYRNLKRFFSGNRVENRVKNNDSVNNAPDNCFRNLLRKGIKTFLYIPDEHWGWILFAAIRGSRLVKKEKIKVIYSSGPPWSTHLAALIIQIVTGCRWIAEFRDPWARDPWRGLDTFSFFSKRIDRFLEKAVVNRSSKILCVTDELSKDFISRYGLDKKKISVVHNGYDSKEFDYSRQIDQKNSRLVLTHLGSLYGNRNPEPLFQSIVDLLDEKKIPKNEILLRFVGEVGNKNKFIKFLKKHHYENVVDFVSRVPRAEAFEIMMKSDVLIIIQNDASMQIPVKLYEYFATGTPVFCLAQEGAVKTFIENENAGVVVSPDDNQSIKKELFAYFQEWSSGRIKKNDVKRAIIFDREYLAGNFAHLLDEEWKIIDQ